MISHPLHSALQPGPLFAKVLLVEDDPGHALLIKRALRDFASEIHHALSVREAVTHLKSETPHLIITDLNLPDSRSLAHVSQFVQHSPTVPVIVLTSSASLKDAVEAMRLGASDYLVKNFDNGFRDALGLALARLFATQELAAERTKLLADLAVLKLAIENSNDGLAVIAAQGEIIYSNRAFTTFMKWCGGESTNFLHIFTPRIKDFTQLKENFQLRQKTLQTGAIWHTEVSFIPSAVAENLEPDRDLAYDVGLTNLSPPEALGGPKSAAKTVLWVRDISELKRRERFQRDLLSTTTHDLKGPLGAILISTELLDSMLKPEGKAKELLSRVGSAAQGSVNLIDEFLSARRIQEGTFILKPVSQNVVPSVQKVFENYQSIAGPRGVTLRLNSPDQIIGVIDKLGFERVVGNLLSNAIKFTAKGGSVETTLSCGAGGEIICSVSDTGTGMDSRDVSRLFNKFSRLERHADVSGTGLGLFVVKSIVNAHGGKVDVTSQVGKGTTFEVVLPAKPPVNERGEVYALDF